MATAKVILNGTTLMDVTGDTVTADTLAESYTATKNDGTKLTGTLSPGGSLETGSQTITATESTQSIQMLPTTGYDGFDEVDITVNAIPSNYVGSGVTQRTSADLSASGATVTAPAGYYASSASTAVASGTEGTPTATKGVVSGHAVSVTPSVTNSAGYISGGTKTGTAVSVSASELVSGTYSVTGSGTKDVTNYASISVPSGSATTPATTVTANPSISVNGSGLITASVSKTQSVTPSVSAGYVSSGTAGTVTVSGSNTQQLSAQAAQTITPTTTDQTIASGKYLTGTQTIKGDANLLPENIVNGVTIFGVTGTAQGGGGGDMYDIVIKCTNANGFSNTASDYVVETGSFDAIATKVYNGDKIDGIVYCRNASYDDEDEYWTYGYDILRIFSASMTGDSGWWEGLGLNFRGDTVTGTAGSRYTLRQRTLYVNKANDDPNIPPSFIYKDESQFIYTP